MIKEFIKENYIWIIIMIMYIAMLITFADSMLQMVKDKMIIDYIFDWFEKIRRRDT